MREILADLPLIMVSIFIIFAAILIFHHDSKPDTDKPSTKKRKHQH